MDNLDTLRSFIDSTGGQAQAARLVGRSRSTINRLYHGESSLTVELAVEIQRVSNNKFLARDLLGVGSSVYLQSA